VEQGIKTGAYSTHFVQAREMYNIALAAINGETGDPNHYRNFRLVPVMQSVAPACSAAI
jgi:hypothetical protein